jgi:hypothetical protein
MAPREIRMKKTLGYILGAAIALAVLSGAVAIFWNPAGSKTHFDPEVP